MFGEEKVLGEVSEWVKKNISSNKLTVVIVEKIPMEEEPAVSAIPEIMEEEVKK